MTERTEWLLDRQEAVANGGMVAAKTLQAAEAGAKVLRAGGNAIDAAVATAFTAGVVEPWMSGLGGGGYLVAHFPDGRDPVVVEFPMISPAYATPGMFPLASGEPDSALFGWPSVVGGANIVGHRAVAVPGVVDGLALALRTFGTKSLAEVMTPAIEYAEAGTEVSWYTTLTMARDLASLQRFPETVATYLDANGNPPVTIDQLAPKRLKSPALAATLRLIADKGPRVFYEGEIASKIVAELNAHDAPVTLKDFANYRATFSAPVTAEYHGHQVLAVGGGTGGSTLVEGLNILDQLLPAGSPHNDPEALHWLTLAFRSAFADRFAYLADPEHVDVPVQSLTSRDHAASRAGDLRRLQRLAPIPATDATTLGISHGLAPSIPDYVNAGLVPDRAMADGSTTHLSVIDRAGMAVSLTQTLLSLWGSRVVVPGTGVLLNNGMMWFDPEPGRPNSIAGGKRPLANMAPALLLRDGQIVASIGSSGGRKIMNCNAQLVVNLVDHGLTMQPAISAPRIDASTAELQISRRLPESTRAALEDRGHRVSVIDERYLLGEFASPAAVQKLGSEFRGGADPYAPNASAVGIQT